MAEQKRDYYEVLGVEKSADDAAIKKAYRALAKKYHPDMNPGDAEAEKKFKEASEAYAVLSDPEKRRQYDQYGHAAFDGAGGAGGFGGFDFNSADFGDIFGDIFGDLFGGGRRSGGRSSGPMKGANIRTSVRITFEEAVFGVEKEIELTLKDECTSCHGTGAKPGTSPETCSKCGGKGQVVFTQQSFFGTVRNVQTCPDCHGPRGDLLVEVVVGRHPIFQRQNENIYSTVPMSFAVAALGGEIVIDTVDGKVIYDVKAGTQTDTRIRLKGKGVPSLRSKDVRGDHYVTLVVQVPDKLSHEAKELLKQFDGQTGDTLNAAKNISADTHEEQTGGSGKKKKKFKF